LALHLNQPLLGQRVRDLLAVVGYFAGEQDFSGVHLFAAGATAPVAFHAAALDPRIKMLGIRESLASWSSVVHTPVSHNQLANAVPGALAYYDLPDLAATLAPRPLGVAGAVDPVNKPLTRAELEKVYSACTKAYGDKKAQRHLTLKEKP